MSSAETQLSLAPRLGFKLIAGALAGLIFAAEVNLLQLLVWRFGCFSGMDIVELAGLSLQNTATMVRYSVGAGLLGGLVSAVLLPRIAAEIPRLKHPLFLLFWMLFSFPWTISADFPFVLCGLIAAILTVVLATAAHLLWCRLLEWLLLGHVNRVILAIAVIGVSFWTSLVAHVIPL